MLDLTSQSVINSPSEGNLRRYKPYPIHYSLCTFKVNLEMSIKKHTQTLHNFVAKKLNSPDCYKYYEIGTFSKNIKNVQ